MKLGMIGLGKMGGNMVLRLTQGGVEVIGYDRSEESVAQIERQGARGARSMDDLIASLGEPGTRAVWVMVPAGKITQSVIDDLAGRLAPGDIVIDGGNSNYKDSIRRAEELAEKGIHFVDVGTSGGVWGLKEGYAMMIGGAEEAVERLRPAFEALAPAADRGWGRMGPAGSGHYVKMVHNGIEYGMMQAYAEGFELMKAHQDFNLDMAQIAELWRHGSVVRSWLLDLTAEALQNKAEFEKLGLRGGQWRGPLDDHRLHRTGRADARDHAGDADALPQPAGGQLRRADALGDAPRVRRARREDHRVPRQEGLVPEVAPGDHPKVAAPENIGHAGSAGEAALPNSWVRPASSA